MNKEKTKTKKIRVQAVLDESLVEIIDDMAGKMGMTRSFFLSCLLDYAVEDERWLINFLNTRVARGLLSLYDKLDGGKRKRKAKKNISEYEQLSKRLEDEK